MANFSGRRALRGWGNLSLLHPLRTWASLALVLVSGCQAARNEDIASAHHPASKDGSVAMVDGAGEAPEDPPAEDEPANGVDAAQATAEIRSPALDAGPDAASVDAARPLDAAPATDTPSPVPEGDAAPALYESHFHIVFREVDQNVDCEMLDVDASDPGQGLGGASYALIGGFSQSTNQAFRVNVPLSAVRLRDPAIVRSYPIYPWASFVTSNSSAAVFELGLRLVDSTGVFWVSCAAGSCGLSSPDAAHQHTVTKVVEQPATTQGVASFRMYGSYQARVRALDGTDATATAHGDWSLLVAVADPGPLACFNGCESSASGTCVDGRADMACGKAGSLCEDCNAAGLVCVEGACRVCRPGTSSPSSCANGCGQALVTCDATGMWQEPGACTLTQPLCGGACCGSGQLCVQCPLFNDTFLMCIPATSPPGGCTPI